MHSRIAFPSPRRHRDSRPSSRRDGTAGHVVVVACVAALSLVVTALTVGTASPARAVEITSGLSLWYPLSASSGTTATDASGHGRDGTVKGGVSWGGSEGLTFNGTDTAVKLPDNLLAGLDSISVAADVFIDPSQGTPYFIYGLGNTSGGNGNGYLFTTGDSYRTSIATGNWSTEQTVAPSTPRSLLRGGWSHLAYTLTGGTAVLYLDGVEIARKTGVTITPGAIGGGVTTSNLIGQSEYSGDTFFKGKIRDFRIYDRALTGTEVAQLATPATAQSVALDKAWLSLGDTSAVTANLTLPATGANGSAITWTSSAPSVVAAGGAVTRPAIGQPSATVTLTAVLAKGAAVDTKTFTVTVLATADDAGSVRADAAALVVYNLADVRGNLTLPGAGANASTVSWASDNAAVISADGVVHRPAAANAAVTVTLTATVTLNAASTTRAFTATVPALPAAQPLKGYLFSYFTGEGTANGEQVYFGLSKGNDPLHWQQLNNGQPTLVSTLGEKGLRDPFIIRSPEGDKFYQIATDLRIYGNGNWDAAQRTGSKSIMVWESTDLVHWTDQRLVKVSPDTAGNTWAPEAFYDPTLGAYVVFWASKLYTDAAHSGDTYNRMMYATTRDFRTFSEPKVWVDRGWSVIDSTMIQDAGTYYRFSKDERSNTSGSPNGKFIFEEKSSSILGSYTPVVEGIGKGVINQGEGPLIFKSNTGNAWQMFIDEFGGRGYVPFESTNLASGVWTPSTNYQLPASPRHGTVLPVTQAEYDRLLATYQPDQLVTGIDDVAVTTGIGDAPTLPTTVTARYVNGTSSAVTVSWDAVSPSSYASAGSFTVLGTVAQSVSVRAKAVVTVTAAGIPVASLTVTPTSLRLGVGVTRAVTATVQPPNATARALTWTSSKPSVATVSATGVVTTVAAGTADITVRTADASKIVTIPLEVTTTIPTHLLLQYGFDESGGTVAHDSSGRGNDGIFQHSPGFGTGVNGGSVVLAGGASGSTTAPYVTIPAGVLQGVNDVTVSAFVKWTASSTVNQWLFGLGPDSNKYLFATPSNGSGVLYSALTTGSWQAENRLPTSAALPGGSWQHLAVVIDSTTKTGTLYLNGNVVATATNVTVKPSDLYDASKSYSGYIGRSLYGADPFFAGQVDDFRIYDQALSAGDIAVLAGNTTSVTQASVPELKVPAIITDSSSLVVLPVKPGTDVMHLAPTFVLSQGATISPASGTVRDLTSVVTYTVTGSDGTTRTWTVKAVAMQSPVIPGLYADPNIVVFGDTYYLYPTTDGFANWAGTQFHAFSSKDLVHWQDHGVILDLGPDVSWADTKAWAPTIASKAGKYYLYFCAEGQIGVAVADSPIGPFKDALGKPLVATGAFPGQMIDPQVFTDDDGQSYLYFGNGGAYVVTLNADMISFDASQVKTITPSGFNEGSFVFKRNGTYYFSWSENDTRDENYRVAYATGSTPFGPWTKHGVILTKDLSQGIKGTGHHSVVQVPGTDDWYIAYHRFAIPGGDGTHRETTVDRLEFNADGTIKAVVPTLTSVAPEVVPDLVPPVTSVSVSPVEPASGWYTGPVAVTVTAQDARDGAVVPQLRVSGPGFGGDWLPQSGALTLAADGVYRVDYRATDVIGNTSPVGSVTVRVDATAPVSSALVDSTARTVTLTGTDSTSGVARLEYSLDGGSTWSAYTQAITVGTAATTVSYRAVDLAGNVEDTNAAEVPAAGTPLATSVTKASMVVATTVFGTPAVVKVTVTGALSQQPKGKLRVIDGSDTVGSANLSSGAATITLDDDVPVGVHTLVISYAGDKRYAASQVTVALTVVKASSKTTVDVQPRTVALGTKVTADVVVQAPAGLKVTGTVTVRVFDGSTWTTYSDRVHRDGTDVVRLGRLTTAGTYTVVASYSGSDQLEPSGSGELTITVK